MASLPWGRPMAWIEVVRAMGDGAGDPLALALGATRRPSGPLPPVPHLSHTPAAGLAHDHLRARGRAVGLVEQAIGAEEPGRHSSLAASACTAGSAALRIKRDHAGDAGWRPARPGCLGKPLEPSAAAPASAPTPSASTGGW